MKFPEDAPVTAEKQAVLRARLSRLGIDLGQVDEQAVKGSGPGGQKMNKTQSGVLLRYWLRRPRAATGVELHEPPGGARAADGEQAADGERAPGGRAPGERAPGERADEEQLVVKWTRERHHALNRFLALRQLADEVELRVSPQTSERLQEAARIRKQKDRTRRRRAAGGPGDQGPRS